MGTILGWPSVAQVGDSTVIAAADTDGSLVFYWQPIGSQQWNPEQVAGPGVAFSPPSVAQVGDSTVIAARGPTTASCSTGSRSARNSGTPSRSPGPAPPLSGRQSPRSGTRR